MGTSSSARSTLRSSTCAPASRSAAPSPRTCRRTRCRWMGTPCTRGVRRQGAKGGRRKRVMADVVKDQVAAHWDRRAANFDEDFGHSIRTPAERAAWDRIFDLVLPARRGLDALDVGCGTGFLTFELAARGHSVTGIDFAPAMLREGR